MVRLPFFNAEARILRVLSDSNTCVTAYGLSVLTGLWSSSLYPALLRLEEHDQIVREKFDSKFCYRLRRNGK